MATVVLVVVVPPACHAVTPVLWRNLTKKNRSSLSNPGMKEEHGVLGVMREGNADERTRFDV